MNTTKTCTLTLTVVLATLALYATAFAGNAASISVSCTVPAIPGVNVPFNEETALREATVSRPVYDQVVVQESETGESRKVLVKTFYTR